MPRNARSGPAGRRGEPGGAPGPLSEELLRSLARRGVRDPRVLEAMAAVPRSRFVEARLARRAADDVPLPIGEGQTTSQPLVVALMAQALELRPEDRVLEVGAGSGYAAAVLGRLAAEVHAVELRPALAEGAARALEGLDVANVHVHVGDGTLGWPPAAPYDAISVAAGGPRVPPPLLEQLAPGGRLVMPVGRRPDGEELVRVRRDAEGATRVEDLGIPVRFVPLVGADRG